MVFQIQNRNKNSHGTSSILCQNRQILNLFLPTLLDSNGNDCAPPAVYCPGAWFRPLLVTSVSLTLNFTFPLFNHQYNIETSTMCRRKNMWICYESLKSISNRNCGILWCALESFEWFYKLDNLWDKYFIFVKMPHELALRRVLWAAQLKYDSGADKLLVNC